MTMYTTCIKLNSLFDSEMKVYLCYTSVKARY